MGFGVIEDNREKSSVSILMLTKAVVRENYKSGHL